MEATRSTKEDSVSATERLRSPRTLRFASIAIATASRPNKSTSKEKPPKVVRFDRIGRLNPASFLTMPGIGDFDPRLPVVDRRKRPVL